MAAPGRKPKNPKLRVIEGNPGRVRIPEQPDLRELSAEAPDYLTAPALQKWNRWVSDLMGKGLFADIHMELLAATCQYWADYETLRAELTDIGLVDDAGKRRGKTMQMNDAYKQARAGMSELGISPSELGRMPKRDRGKAKDFGF